MKFLIAFALLLLPFDLRAAEPSPSLSPPPYTNRLAQEKSPYLLQHAHNPVDWYPWGEEAFARARKENKPILLSVGYSTCHWCHVMERESFENPEIAKLMNENFINIKVDREERPDIDQVYMTFVQATTGSGGWPMNVWLTPDLKPIVGGTYFPPENTGARLGFKTVLKRIAAAWESDREKIISSSDQLLEKLRGAVQQSAAADSVSEGVAQKAYTTFATSFDAKFGGFGDAPKFPRPAGFAFLRDYYGTHRDSPEGKKALEMMLVTLRQMAAGGIHDHLGGGFHRYATDRTWHVPHFEKMLYDQAQLAVAYLDAFQITRDPLFEQTARDILEYVGRDLTAAEGAFFSAEDADSEVPAGAAAENAKPAPKEKKEGAFYVWSKAEIDRLLGPERAQVFAYRYGVEAKGNAPADPQGEFKGKNILIQRHSLAETAKKFNLSAEKVEQRLKESREFLFAARHQRPRPHLDDKIVTAWNGLMVSAFARGHQVLGDPAYLAAANRAADFLQAKLYDPASGQLRRSYREGASDVPGFASDYAFLIQGLLDLYQASFDVRRLEWALTLQEQQNALFLDPKGGGYFSATGSDPSVLFRLKEADDMAEPSPNSVAALNLVRIAKLLDQASAREQAEQTVHAFAQQLESAPSSMPMMLVALSWLRGTGRQIVIAGQPENPATHAMVREVYRHFVPHGSVILADGGAGQKFFAERVEFMQSVNQFDGQPTAYVCENFVCQLPTTDLARLAQLLSPKKGAKDEAAARLPLTSPTPLP